MFEEEPVGEGEGGTGEEVAFGDRGDAKKNGGVVGGGGEGKWLRCECE